MKITFDTGTSGVGALGGSAQALSLDFGLGSIGAGQGTDNMMMQLLMLLMMNLIQSNQNGQQPAQTGTLPLDMGGLGGLGGLDGRQLNADSSNPMNGIGGLLQQLGKLLEMLAPLLQNAGNNMGTSLAMNLGQALEGLAGATGTAGN